MGWGEPIAPVFNAANAVETIGRRDLARRLRAHAELHSDSKDILLEAAAMLDPTKES